MSVLVALVFVVTPTLTHLFIWWLGACKRWYRGCTVLCAFLFAQHSCQERKMGVKRGKEPEMNFVAGMFSLSRNQECERRGEETYIGYHWNVATLRDYSFHIAGSFGPEYGCNAIAYHLSDGLGGQHRITLGVIPAQL